MTLKASLVKRIPLDTKDATEIGGQRSEVGDQKSEIRDRSLEVGVTFEPPRHKGREEDLLSNRGSRFDKPLHPSGISNDLFSYLRILNTHYKHIMTEHVRCTAREENGIGVNICPQGMMVFLISFPDQEKNKSFASFAS